MDRSQAVTSKKMQLLPVLKEAGVNLDFENKYAKTALMLAAEQEATEAVARLVQVGG
jgi:ankyrin repeat protein